MTATLKMILVSLIVLVGAFGCSTTTDSPAIQPETSPEVKDNRTRPLSLDTCTTDNGVVLLVIDTWRADSFTPDLMPTLAEYAQRGVTFTNAWSSGNWTLTGTMGILSGTVPTGHMLLSQDPAAGEVAVLSDEVMLIPDILRDHGYVSGQASSNWIAYTGGIAERFDEAYVRNPKVLGQTLEEEMDRQIVDEVVPQFVAELDERYFVHYQLMTPHSPYCMEGVNTVVNGWDTCVDTSTMTEEDYYQFNMAYQSDPDGFAEGMHDLYRTQVSQTDELIGRLVSQYDDAGLSPVFIVTGDHGEEFFENGALFHGDNLLREQTAVPLIMWGPCVPQGRVVEGPVSTIDIAPTILSLAGIQYQSNQLIGRNLRSVMRADVSGPYRALYESLWWDEEAQTIGFNQAITASVPESTDTWTLVEGSDGVATTLTLFYNETEDPTQDNNLADHPSFDQTEETLSILNVPTPWSDWFKEWSNL